TQSSQPKAASAKPAPSKIANSKGSLPYPITGEKKVVGFFGRSRHHDLSKIEIDNPGIEIQGKAGAQAVAVYDGQVAGVFFIDGLHNAVLVRHGDYITVYANIDTPVVKKGDKVHAGQQLGSVYAEDGMNPVLHFEIRKEKEKLNPMDWIK
ncbi:MAG: peptidoglycan DD-metalloendopeptidase family protein, partial [Muribaculaceae bacterium]|nr:peptidoglycan DD-metalloendopeptidase family protein [Muribaculaceae bacterium]